MKGQGYFSCLIIKIFSKMKSNKMYVAPEVSVWGVAVEEGFAVSGEGTFGGGVAGFEESDVINW